MMDSIGVVTHHDAVTGTEQQHVADDYAKRLSIGTDSAQVLYASLILHFHVLTNLLITTESYDRAFLYVNEQLFVRYPIRIYLL